MKKTFKDQIPPAGGRKYRITANADGTSGIEDVTEYRQEGTPFGAKEAMQLYDGIVPPGMIAPYAGKTAPEGWLLCDGSAVSRTTYADLYAAIGTTYGAGNGSTTFTLPDLRGRVPAGANASNALASKAGADSKNITKANLPNEKLKIADNGNWLVDTAQSGVHNGKQLTLGSGRQSAEYLYTEALGSGAAFDVRQATLYLNYIIKC